MKTVYIVAIACGIALGSFLTSIYFEEITYISQIFHDEYNFVYLGILLACIWVLIEYMMKLLKVHRWRAALILCCGALLFSATRTHHTLVSLTNASLYHFENNHEITLTCTVVAPPDIRTDKQFITCKALHVLRENNTVTTIDNPSNIRIRLPRYLNHSIHHQDSLLIQGKLREPKSFLTDTERTFHYDTYLLVRGVTHTMYRPEILSHTSHVPTTLRTRLFNLKTQLIKQANILVPAPEAGLLAGILYGDQRGISKSQNEIYRETGIVHIVVLSGYNVTLVIIFVHILLKRLNKNIRLILSIIAALLFMIFTGLGSTIVRATIMAIVALLAQHSNISVSPARNLAFAGGLMIMINPLITTWDLSFQLSFLATVGLVYIGKIIEPAFSIIPIRFGMRENAVATIATQITVMPLLLYSIGELSILSPIVNMIVLPFVAPAMLIGFLGSIVTILFPASTPLIQPIVYAPLFSITEISSRFAGIPWISTTVPPIPAWALILSYLCIGLWIYFINRNKI